MFNKGQLAGLMKQATAMQENMKKAQEELANSEVEGAAGSGMVKITMTGKHIVKRIAIDASLVVADDKDMLEDMLTVAFNDAAKSASRWQRSQDGQRLQRHARLARRHEVSVLST